MPGKVSTLMAAMANLLRLKSMFALAAGEAGECQPARRSLACRTSKRQPWTATSFDLPGAKMRTARTTKRSFAMMLSTFSPGGEYSCRIRSRLPSPLLDWSGRGSGTCLDPSFFSCQVEEAEVRR